MDGFQTRVERLGAAVLVQTQDKGPAQYVETLLYASGKILTSKRTFYTPLLNSPNLLTVIRQIMEEQHNGVVEDIRQGRFDRFLQLKETV